MKTTPTRTSDPKSSGVIPRRAAQVVSFEAGSLWRLGAASVSIVKPISVGCLVVRHLIDAHTEVVDTTALKPIPDPHLTNTAERRTATDEHSDVVWERALEEERLIGPLLGNSDLKGAYEGRRSARLKRATNSPQAESLCSAAFD